jgi:hypothetical protein
MLMATWLGSSNADQNVPSRTRVAAGAFGFLTLIQLLDRHPAKLIPITSVWPNADRKHFVSNARQRTEFVDANTNFDERLQVTDTLS